MISRKNQSADLEELALNLSRAHTLRSVADTVGQYCGKALGSPAGMIFVERQGDLKMVSEWHSKAITLRDLPLGTIKKGPLNQAFRSGDPVFWQKKRLAFLPIRSPGKSPVGVLAMVLPQKTVSALPLPDGLLRVRRVVSDCLVRARAYDDALAARLSAEKIIREKDEFFSVISHELKNPMMPILGWAVALSSGTLPAEKQNLALDGIVRNVRALNYLIEDLFDAARISTGKLRLQCSETRIQDVAREVLTSIEPHAEVKKMRIFTDISGAIPPFVADPRRLRQVLANLLNNAVKFTPEGGSISLRISRRGESIECIVSDTGRGIEPKFLPFVFERFTQENRPMKNRSGGLGLGLSIVREIVVLHGGTIKANSEGIDKGCTFVVRLPLRRDRFRQTSSRDSKKHLN